MTVFVRNSLSLACTATPSNFITQNAGPRQSQTTQTTRLVNPGVHHLHLSTHATSTLHLLHSIPQSSQPRSGVSSLQGPVTLSLACWRLGRPGVTCPPTVLIVPFFCPSSCRPSPPAPLRGLVGACLLWAIEQHPLPPPKKGSARRRSPEYSVLLRSGQGHPAGVERDTRQPPIHSVPGARHRRSPPAAQHAGVKLHAFRSLQGALQLVLYPHHHCHWLRLYPKGLRRGRLQCRGKPEVLQG